MHILPSIEYIWKIASTLFPDHNFDITDSLCLITLLLISPHSAEDLFANLSDSATGMCLCWQTHAANHALWPALPERCWNTFQPSTSLTHSSFTVMFFQEAVRWCRLKKVTVAVNLFFKNDYILCMFPNTSTVVRLTLLSKRWKLFTFRKIIWSVFSKCIDSQTHHWTCFFQNAYSG